MVAVESKVRRAYDVTFALIFLTLLATFVIDQFTDADLRVPMRLLDLGCIVLLLVWQFHRIQQERARDRLLSTMRGDVERARLDLAMALGAGGLGAWQASARLDGTRRFLQPALLATPFAADDTALAICGYEPGTQLTCEDYLKRIHREDRDRALATLESLFREGTHVYRDQYRIVRPDGETRTLSVRGSLTREREEGDDYTVVITGVARDVTDEEALKANLIEKAEEARRAKDAKGRFLAMMSHEVRTPMNGVMGMLDLVIDTPLQADQRHMLVRCRDSARALLTIVNDILDFSKVEAGKLEIESTSLSLRSLIEDVSADHRLQAQRKGVALETDINAALPQFILGDPVRLRQILGNLIGNAVKFTRAGHVRVRAGVCAPASWFLEVEDTGPGIEPDALARLFQPFQQAEVSTTRQFGGTGLGLSIVKQLAELMEGSVECWSEPGRGSRFRVVLPLRPWVPEMPQGTQDSAKEALAQVPRLAKRRFLLAEDSPINQDVIARQLAKLGHECECAEDGEEAWRLLRAPGAAYDALITDANMPRLDGFGLTARIREWERRHDAPRLPILAMTANALHGEREHCLASGMDGYVSKPVDLAQLQRALYELLVPEGAAAADVVAEDTPAPVDEYPGLHALCSHDGDAVRHVLTTFLSSITRDAAALRTALHGGAADQMRQLAHRMASGCLQLGEREAQQALQSIEDATTFAEMRAAYPHAEAALRDALARARAFVERQGESV